MTIKRLENVGIVVEDLDAVVAFFIALGLELEGEATVEDEYASRISGLDDVRLDVAMLSVVMVGGTSCGVAGSEPGRQPRRRRRTCWVRMSIATVVWSPWGSGWICGWRCGRH